MVMTPALAETLAMLSEAASGARDPWWIIGSAAVVLHGRSIDHVKDVDLVMSAADGEILISLTEGHAPTAGYLKKLRTELPQEFPDLTEPLLFGPLLPPRYRLSGPGAQPHAAARFAEQLAASPRCPVDPADLDAVRSPAFIDRYRSGSSLGP